MSAKYELVQLLLSHLELDMEVTRVNFNNIHADFMREISIYYKKMLDDDDGSSEEETKSIVVDRILDQIDDDESFEQGTGSIVVDRILDQMDEIYFELAELYLLISALKKLIKELDMNVKV